MREIFDEMVRTLKSECALFYSSKTKEIIYQHNFDIDSEVGKQIIRLIKRVCKIRQTEYCKDVGVDPLFKMMGLTGSFICAPMISEEELLLGAVFFNSGHMEITLASIEKNLKLLANSYYEDLRNQTRKEVESQARVVSQRLKRYLSMGMSCGGRKIVGIDPIMEEQVFSCIEMYKSENCSPALIMGESGTGKELVASALHYRSERKNQSYLRFNCAEIASVDPQMQRVELFGCMAGIAPGVVNRKGLFELADKGTLFLDEIGLLSMEAQGQLLRVLEDHKIRPVGEKKDIQVNVRLIFANNQPLQELVKEGIFRQDLFYRICSFVINIPPLRQRGINDHNLLIDYFIEEENRQTRSNKKITNGARAKLHGHHWPGNVRELRATLRRAFYKVVQKDGLIDTGEIEFVTHETKLSTEGMPQLFPKPWQKLADLEKEVFRQACLWAQGSPKERTQGRAAEMLGIHANTMSKKLKEYGLQWPKGG